jgi:hypothetical protein
VDVEASSALLFFGKDTKLLKVVGNEKLGGSRGWLLVEGDTELWRSMFVYFLM